MLYRYFNLVPEIDTYSRSNEERLPHWKKHTGLLFCAAMGAEKPSFSTFILTVNRVLRPLREITGTDYNFGAETLLAIMDAAAALVIVFSPSVCV